jgi:hypothetical protein
MARPGKTPIHHLSNCCVPSATIAPHSAVGGLAPSPRKDSPDSNSVAVPMSRVARTRSGPSTLGRMSTRRDRQAEKPNNRPLSTNSRFRRPMTRPRVTRAYDGQDTTRTASTAFCRLAPSAAATTIARMTVGKANTRSAIRITVSSTHRPKNPAQAPSTPPTSSDMATSSRASGMETRAPYSTRLSTSRPNSSVPNQCPEPGAVSRGRFCARGSCGASSGAATTITSQNSATRPPVTASGRRQAGGSRRRRPRLTAPSGLRFAAR